MKEIVEQLRAGAAAGMRGAEAARDEAYREAIGLARRKIDEGLALRRQYERRWAAARAYLYGYENVRIAGDRIDVDRGIAQDETFRVNVIRPRVRSLLSMLTSNRPRFQAVVGDVDDPRAVEAAKLGDEWLEAIFEYVGMHRATLRAISSVLLTGRGYLYAGFDGARGPIIARSGGAEADAAIRVAGAAQSLLSAATGADEAMAEETTVIARDGAAVVRKGDFFAAGLSSWDVVYDAAADGLASSPWVAVRWVMTKEEAEDRYGEGGENGWKVDEVDTGVDLGPGDHATRKGVVVWEMLWRKTGEYPLGLRLLFHGEGAGARLLHWSEQASRDGDLPIAEVRSDEEPGRPYSVGVVYDLIQPQIWFNKLGRWIMKHAELTADPRIHAPEGQIREASIYQDVPGRYLFYDRTAGGPPGYMIPPAGAGTLQAILQLLDRLLDFLAQQWEPARGQPIGSVTSGIMAQLLIERTGTSWSMVSNSLEAALARCGKNLLMEGQVRMPEGWQFALAGSYPRPKVKTFRSADLAGITEVHVVAGSTRPDSKSARQSFYLDLLRAIGGPIDEARRSIVDAMDAGVRLPADPFQVVRDKARDENIRILEGEEIDPIEEDFHDIEIDEHLRFMAGEEFRTAAPRAQAALRAHVKAHRQLLDLDLVEQASKQAAIQAAAAGAGDGGFGGAGGGAGGAGDDLLGVSPAALMIPQQQGGLA